MNTHVESRTLLLDGEPDELLTAAEVGRLFKLSAKTILNNWRSLKLPAPISIGEGQRAAKRWRKSEIDEYAANRCLARDRRLLIGETETRRNRLEARRLNRSEKKKVVEMANNLLS
ncbi:MAG: hypothetical protein AB1631_33795 [Acidobacteriota bacterium]